MKILYKLSCFSLLVLLTGSLFFSCKKKYEKVGMLPLDTIVSMEFIIHVKNMHGEFNVQSTDYPSSGRGSKFLSISNNNIIVAQAIDSLHIPICSDTLHYSLPISISSTRQTNIYVSVASVGPKGSAYGNYQFAVFTYSPSSKTMTSTILPRGQNPYNMTGNPNTNSVLDHDTDFSTTCNAGKWVLYVRYR